MADARQPFDPSRPNLSEVDGGSPTTPAAAHGAEVEGYIMFACSACGHTHKQSDPKCNHLCGHGSVIWSGGLTGGTGSTY